MAELGLDPLLAKVLYARKLDTPAAIRSHLYAPGTLADPMLLLGMSGAVQRLRAAIAAGEPVVVYGDFDTDGVSATVLLTTALRTLGAEVAAYIPDRFSESYGLNVTALDRLSQVGARLVVAVDCGVRSVDEAAHAHSLGLDLIVVDHHSVRPPVPECVAVIDPKQPGCAYPFKDLAGVGLAYRTAQALWNTVPTADPAALDALLDLVALGTVADVVPLVGENRLLVQAGLRRLREHPRAGLLALMQAAGITPQRADSQDIAFRLAPRLNAAGRLGSAQLALDLLTCEEPSEATRMAAELNALNQERQRLLDEQVAAARALLGGLDGSRLLMVDGPDFHEGIVGLVASRLTDEYYRPCLVLKSGPETTRGSARSIEGFHVTRALDSCADLLLRHGGHARAAGLTLRSEHLPALRERLQEYAQSNLPDDCLVRPRRVDAIVSLDELSPQVSDALEVLAPFGEGNPEPALATMGVRVNSLRPVGAEGKHLKLRVQDGQQRFAAIAFGMGHLAAGLRDGDVVDLIYRPQRHEWQGTWSLELVVEAMRSTKRVGAAELSAG